jgi:predicted ATPase
MGITVGQMDSTLKADIISNVILGRYYGIPGPGAVKQRVFKKIPAEFNKFYMDSDAALTNHIHSMRKRIEARPKDFLDLTYPTGDIKFVLQNLNERFSEDAPAAGLYLFEGYKGSGKSHLLLLIYHLLNIKVLDFYTFQ